MLYRISGLLPVELLALALSVLVIAAVLLGVLRLVFSIGNWKTRMGILREFKNCTTRHSQC
jgi:hypothetical protein